MRVIAENRHDLPNFLVLTEHDACLGGIEIQCSIALTRLSQGVIQSIEIVEWFQQGLVTIAQCRLQIFLQRRLGDLHDVSDLVIGHATVGMDYRLIEEVVRHDAVFVNFHFTHERQAIDMRLERTQAIGELLGQHRNHMPREIHRGGAIRGLFIERTADADIMGNVGDGDIKGKCAVAMTMREHGIVEVLRVFAIYRDEGNRAQVLAPLQICWQDFIRKPIGLFLDSSGELMGDVMAAQRDVDLQARGLDITQDLDDLRDRLAMALRILEYFSDDKLAVSSLASVLVGNQDLVTDALAVGDNDAEPLLPVIATHNLDIAALQHLDNHALLAAATVDACHPRQHDVAVEQFLHFAGIQEQVVRAVIRYEEAEAILVALYPALQQFHVGRQSIDSAAITDDLAVATHGDQPAPQGLDGLVIGQLELLTELSVTHGLTEGLQVLLEKFPAGDRIGVVVRLALGEGIFRGFRFRH